MRWLQQVPRVLVRSGITPSCQRFSPSLQRHYSAALTLPPDIAFEELTQKLADKQVTLIDVRLPYEHVEVGTIPDSKNVPLQILGLAILQPDEKFAEKRGFSKPSLDQPLVVTCLAGVRARTAQLALLGAGYTNVRVYVGSFEDWVEKGGKVEFPKVEEEEEKEK
ncbi:rhodanese domain-containing protein CG4456-like [Eriocheir sinensis]|uniref:rhodanese domain-containing protein CG4456-like n=1 Tax=Eriocheir sinensis TaxID=95602 RepID=UPI0021CA0A89|nr:rhodanese domain-containing protein CG4456-like [Eriocheir sinensis]XP_050698197.1 rhodanese domain-containing protein CG4456-like [Eriocheir sinensis]